jgi:hypothetical protein
LIKPISPDNIASAKADIFPDYVIESVNELIAANFSAGSANFTQDEVIDAIMSKAGDLTRAFIFSKGYLNFEELYEAQGWKVVYDKPAYNESYKANFTFIKPPRGC